MRRILFLNLFCMLAACTQSIPVKPTIPAEDYAKRIKKTGSIQRLAEAEGASEMQMAIKRGMGGPQMPVHDRRADGSNDFDSNGAAQRDQIMAGMSDLALSGPQGISQDFQPQAQPYNGPLSLGDPGEAASLWRESGGTPDFFRDARAWQPMDLLTIVISEQSEGKKTADTEVKEKSSILASIEGLLGFEADVTKSNPNTDLTSLLKASNQQDFKGEGKTNRKDSLSGTISAMIAEVLPSGIMRIEGTKIIAVNNEEQVMVISGLIRPRDISSDNTVESSRIANMRIDYFGKGELGDVQSEGWLGRIIRKVWPF